MKELYRHALSSELYCPKCPIDCCWHDILFSWLALIYFKLEPLMICYIFMRHYNNQSKLTCQHGQHHGGHGMMQQYGEQQIVIVQDARSLVTRLDEQSAQHKGYQQINADSNDKCNSIIYLRNIFYKLTVNESASRPVCLSDSPAASGS